VTADGGCHPLRESCDLDGNVISLTDAPGILRKRSINTMTTATILLLVSDSVGRMVLQETMEHAGYSVMSAGDLGTAVI